MNRSLLIIDNSFTEAAGHNLPYIDSLARQAADREIEVGVVTNRRLPMNVAQTINCPVKRLFRIYAPLFARNSRVWKGRRRYILGFLIGNYDMARVLFRVFREAAPADRQSVPAEGTVLLCANTFAENIFGIWLYLRFVAIGRSDKPTSLCLVFHNRPPDRVFELVRRTAAKCARLLPTTIVVHSVSNEDITAPPGRTVRLRLPYVGRKVPAAPREPESVPRVSFLGIATENKGFDVMVSAIERIIRRERSRCIFDIQVNPRQVTAPIKESVERLERLSDAVPRLVSLRHGTLTARDYDDLFSKTDIMLLPHRSAAYPADESGVFLECEALGKVVIAARGTAMAARVEKGDVRGCTFEDGDSGSLADAILNAVRRFDHREQDPAFIADPAEEMLSVVLEA